MAGGATRIDTPTATWAWDGDGAAAMESRPMNEAKKKVRIENRLRIIGSSPKVPCAPVGSGRGINEPTFFLSAGQCCRFSGARYSNPSLRLRFRLGGRFTAVGAAYATYVIYCF